MSELMICRICLQTEANMYRWNRSGLKYYYTEVISIKLHEKDQLPQYFCYECAALLHKFYKFKEMCYRGLNKLQELLCKGPITLEGICQIDRKIINLKSSLGILTVSKRVKTYYAIANLTSETDGDSAMFDKDRLDDKNVVENIDFLHDGNGDLFNDIHSDNKPVHSDDEKPLKYYKGLETILKADIADGSSTTLSGNEKKVRVKIKSKPVKGTYGIAGKIIETRKKCVKRKEPNPKKIMELIKKQKESPIKNIAKLSDKPKIQKRIKIMKNIALTKKTKKPNKLAMEKQKKSLDASHWNKYTLSEEEALKEFREKGESPRFATWPFKCLDCFKGFSKEKLFKDHRRLKHDESLQHECRFCHMRYRWNAKMREHMRQHFNKFQCLRCDYVCPLEHTALLHDDVHNGVIKKCEFCNAEFTHLMSYYSHRRSHKSQYACSHCGVSFMSRRGLNMHKRVKHIDDKFDRPNDENNGKTFCEKCDIRFETKKAYDQHLFHSAMHVQGIDNDSKEESGVPKKVEEKAVKTEISKELSKCRTVDVGPLGSFKFPGIGKRRRSFKKPMDCYQCGKHFETQQECRKHHLAEHPRTSFFPPSERHICEICGASLAPDSVAHHLNTHTREKVYPCVTCGRHFHASVNLKRHMLTHTGEKPYSCSLCDKKFTQPTNMKLHYKIYHSKEPIPKRVRRKKDNKTAEHNAEDSGNHESSQSLPNAPALTSESAVTTTLTGGNNFQA